MGAIKSRSKVTVSNCMKFAHLNDSDQDCRLEYQLMLDAIKELADDYCDNPFILEDEDGDPVLDDDENEQPQDIPSYVELWIMRKFARINEYRLSGNNKLNTADIGSIHLDSRDWAELINAVKFDG